MKLSVTSVICLSVLIIETSCKKSDTGQENDCPPVPRTIQFSLFTDKDFSNSGEIITFTLSIRKSNKILWDSVLPPMKIKDIPSIENKIVIEKMVPGNDTSLLKVGYLYYIEDVGLSWYWNKSKPCETLKKVDFNFR